MIDGVDRNLALVGGVESMSRIQLGLGQRLSDPAVPASAIARPED
jgi:acetyl-CoA C-acetyltransferase